MQKKISFGKSVSLGHVIQGKRLEGAQVIMPPTLLRFALISVLMIYNCYSWRDDIIEISGQSSYLSAYWKLTPWGLSKMVGISRMNFQMLFFLQ